MPESCSQELKSKTKPSPPLLAAEETSTVGSVMHCEDFGDLQKLFRVTAYVLRAVEQFKIKRNLRANLPNTLSPEEISASELLWVTQVQRELVQQKDYDTLKKQLRLFRDEKACGDVADDCKMQTYPMQQNIQSCYLGVITTLA